jgi:soluble lytic murein transglycosylase
MTITTHSHPRTGKLLFFLILLAFSLIPMASSADDGSAMQRAFWRRDWGGMDSIYGSAAVSSADAAPISSRDRSLYLNALWFQGKYADGVAILEDMLKSEDASFPPELRPYAGMLLVLGQERTGRKSEAYENAWALWNGAPPPLKYYLAFALARLSRDLAMTDEPEEWFRRMLEFSPDKKRRLQALTNLIEMPGVNADEAAELLAAHPSNAKALAFCEALPQDCSPAAYALGYGDYLNKKYESAMSRFEMASRDIVYGEAARYYHAYSAYREKKNKLALSLWSDIVLSGDEFPQRSVQRLTALAGRGLNKEVLAVLRKTAKERTDFPELAADALVALIRLGDAKTASEARKQLYSEFPGTNQAATARWENGWKDWKVKNYKGAYEQWAGGFSREVNNRELASRLLYWQSRALEKIGSPVAAERVKRDLTEWYPAEYHAFLANPRGGIISTDVPTSYDRGGLLEDWGFVTYARLVTDMPPAASGNVDESDRTNIPGLYRSVRLALWEGDYSSAARTAGALQRAIPASEYAASEILKSCFPKAFEREVMDASKQTGIEPAIIWGVMRQESLYEPDVTSSAGAYGLMQLMPATARAEAKKLDMDADSYRTASGNVLLGANHLVGLFARFKDAPRSLAAYNAGGTPVARWSVEPISDMAEWVEDIGYAETRGYVKAVLRNIEVYRMLYPGP